MIGAAPDPCSRQPVRWLALCVLGWCAVATAPPHARAEASVGRVLVDGIVPSSGDDATQRIYLRVESSDGSALGDIGDARISIVDNGSSIDPESIHWTTVAETRRGVAAVLVLDASRSMRGPPFDQAKRAALAFVERMGELDQVAVVTFNDEVAVVGDFGTPREALRDGIAALAVQKKTLAKRVWDGALKGLELIDASRDALPRRIFLLVFSDGRDSGSETTPEALAARANGGAQVGRTPIYSVGYMGFGSAGLVGLEGLSQSTGAQMVQLHSPVDLDRFFEDITGRMNQSLVVSYPADFDGRLHRVEVSIDGHGDAREVVYPSRPGRGRIFWFVPFALAAGAAFWIARRRDDRPTGELVIVERPGVETRFALTRRSVRLGALDTNDIVLNYPSVSRHHAELHFVRGGAQLEDRNSRNGTYINDQRIHAPSTLRPGDRIRLGDLELQYRT